MCGSGPAWKREVVQDHKFDFIDVREFHSKEFMTRLKYMFLYGMVFKSFLVYMSDIFTATTMLSTNSWSNQIQNSCSTSATKNGCVIIPFGVAKWLFVGCIIFSFLLLGYEARKAKKIIASRDISYAFTNVMAQNYYSLRSFDHFCLFCQISNSTKKKDDFAFFVFFTFKGWKRLLLADGPRQSINALTLYSFYLSKVKQGHIFDLKTYSSDFITSALIVVTLFTVLVFLISLLLMIAAVICYIPLVCYIRGNLKEYCCHKVDKRIAELIKRKNKQRVAKQVALAKKEAAGDFSHLKDKTNLPQPTLPSVSLDDDEPLKQQRGPYAPSISTSSNWQSEYKADYSPSNYYPEYPDYPPPMPEYQPYSHAQPAGGYATYGHSAPSLPHEDYDESDYGSTFNLAAAAAPVAHQRGYSNSNLNVSQSSPAVTTPTSNPYGTLLRDNSQHPGAGQYDASQYDRQEYGGSRGGYNNYGHGS